MQQQQQQRVALKQALDDVRGQGAKLTVHGLTFLLVMLLCCLLLSDALVPSLILKAKMPHILRIYCLLREMGKFFFPQKDPF